MKYNSSDHTVSLGAIIEKVLEPVLDKGGGIPWAVIRSWEQIVGANLSRNSYPKKIRWKGSAWNKQEEARATLIIACEGAAALHIQHQTSEIISRINIFFGYNAIGRVRIVQKPPKLSMRSSLVRLPVKNISKSLHCISLPDIKDKNLRASLERFGNSIQELNI